MRPHDRALWPLGLAIISILLLPTAANAQCQSLCADHDCDDGYSLYDLDELNRLLYQNLLSCLPLECYGVDGAARVNARDVAWLARVIYHDGPLPVCDPEDTALSVQPGTDYFVVYDTIFPAGVSLDTLRIHFVNLAPWYSTSTPFRIRIDGQIPSLGGSGMGPEIPTTGPMGRGAYNIYRPSGEEHGEVLIGRNTLYCCIEPGRSVVTPNVIMELPAAPVDRRIELEWYRPDSLLGTTPFSYPAMAVNENLEMVEIHFGPRRCPFVVTGDVDMSGDLTASDIVKVVNYVFKSGHVPEPCAPAGDANCDLSISSPDIIYLVNHVFKGGPAPPCDLCTIYSDPWDCWTMDDRLY